MLILVLNQNSAKAQEYVPEEGMEGKDVIWWPTSLSLVDAMLDKAKVGPGDTLVDLGSGDGRIVIEAAKRGAIAIGIEYNPDLVKLSQQRAKEQNVADRVQFLNMDLFEYDLSEATVVTMYLLSSLNLKLRPIILGLRPGTRIVSNTFDMGEWEADEEIFIQRVDNKSPDGQYRTYTSTSLGYYWMVPAKVEGAWVLGNNELNLHQTYQILSGTVKSGSNSVYLEGGRMYGNEIAFTVNGKVYKGTVDENRMSGTFFDGHSEKPWQAVRK
jgi:SAM-dependent methyltransferase